MATLAPMNKTAYVGAVLAGGKASRFGADKAMTPLGGRPMIAHVARALAGAEALAVVGHAAAADLLRAEALHDPDGVVAGPLAGVLAGLDWAEQRGAPWLVTAPCDTPLLPADFAARLIAAAEGARAPAALACVGDDLHALCAAWRPALAGTLRQAFARGVHPPVRALAPDAARVDFADAEAFLNVNTAQDFARAEALLQAR